MIGKEDMRLADREIRKYLNEGIIRIEPMPNLKKSLGSCSIDLRLGAIKNNNGKKYILKPGEFALASTIEYIELPIDLSGTLHGRSSLGRKGLMIHSTAPLFDAGFKGKVILELFNVGKDPIELGLGERVCAFSFEQLSSPAEISYNKKRGAKYYDQREIYY